MNVRLLATVLIVGLLSWMPAFPAGGSSGGNPEHFESPVYGFTVTYPSEWSVTERSNYALFTNEPIVPEPEKVSSLKISVREDILRRGMTDAEKLEKLQEYLFTSDPNTIWESYTLNKMDGFQDPTQSRFFLIWNNYVLELKAVRSGASGGSEAVNRMILSLNVADLLHNAIEHGELETVRMLLNSGVAPSIPRRDSLSPLMTAFQAKQFAIADLILSFNPPVDQRNRQNDTALMYAAEVGAVNQIRVLLARDANVNAENNLGMKAINFTIHSEGLESAKLLMEARTDLASLIPNETTNPLALAVKKRVPELVAYFLSLGLNPNLRFTRSEKFATPMWIAKNEIQWTIVQMLANAGGDINIGTTAGDEQTFLQIAAAAGEWDEVLFLLGKRANPNGNVKQKSPLSHLLAQSPENIRNDVLDALLGARATIIGSDITRTLPFNAPNYQLATKLLRAGADINSLVRPSTACAANEQFYLAEYLCVTAADQLDWQLIEFLTANGYDLNRKDRIADGVATPQIPSPGFAKDLATFQRLVELGANPRLRFRYSNQEGKNDQVNYLYHFTGKWLDLVAAEYFVGLGVDAKVQAFGDSVITRLVKRSRTPEGPALVRYFLSLNVDANLGDPIPHILYKEHSGELSDRELWLPSEATEIASALVGAGANVDASLEYKVSDRKFSLTFLILATELGEYYIPAAVTALDLGASPNSSTAVGTLMARLSPGYWPLFQKFIEKGMQHTRWSLSSRIEVGQAVGSTDYEVFQHNMIESGLRVRKSYSDDRFIRSIIDLIGDQWKSLDLDHAIDDESFFYLAQYYSRSEPNQDVHRAFLARAANNLRDKELFYDYYRTRTRDKLARFLAFLDEANRAGIDLNAVVSGRGWSHIFVVVSHLALSSFDCNLRIRDRHIGLDVYREIVAKLVALGVDINLNADAWGYPTDANALVMDLDVECSGTVTVPESGRFTQHGLETIRFLQQNGVTVQIGALIEVTIKKNSRGVVSDREALRIMRLLEEFRPDEMDDNLKGSLHNAMIWAINNGDPNLVTFLVRSLGANPNGFGPEPTGIYLREALEQSQGFILRLLVDLGADINLPAADGRNLAEAAFKVCDKNDNFGATLQLLAARGARFVSSEYAGSCLLTTYSQILSGRMPLSYLGLFFQIGVDPFIEVRTGRGGNRDRSPFVHEVFYSSNPVSLQVLNYLLSEWVSPNHNEDGTSVSLLGHALARHSLINDQRAKIESLISRGARLDYTYGDPESPHTLATLMLEDVQKKHDVDFYKELQERGLSFAGDYVPGLPLLVRYLSRLNPETPTDLFEIAIRMVEIAELEEIDLNVRFSNRSEDVYGGIEETLLTKFVMGPHGKFSPGVVVDRDRFPLERQFYRRSARMLTKLLAAGADPSVANGNGYTPLQLALISDFEEMAFVFLRSSNPGLTLRDPDGNTALHLASRYSCTAKIDMRYSEGWNWKISECLTPKAILCLGADPEIRNLRRETPMHFAASTNSDTKETIFALHHFGADWRSRDIAGRSVLEVANGWNINKVRMLPSITPNPPSEEQCRELIDTTYP